MLPAGAHLGPYEILGVLGAGGMGEVYKGRDPRLNRLLALKVLPDTAAFDPDRRARFAREAQAVAALNHPHIVTIYSIEEADGRTFLTMELVEGRPLSEVIDPRGLPIGRLLAIALPVVEAVAAAHQRGITHRDLKPANIMIGTGEQAGRIKVLDFGLAKPVSAGDGSGSSGELPTALATGEGRVVGTVAYMSPEQAEGKPVDARSDLFAVGVILYELATGRRPFTGDTSLSVISSILKDAPRPVGEINPALPRELWRIVRRALSKDPERRYQTAKDLRNDLLELKESLDSGELERTVADPAPAPRRRVRPWAALAGIVAIAAGAFVYLALSGVPDSDAPEELFQVRPLTSSGNARSPAIAPDGRYVAYVQGGRDQESIWIHQIGSASQVEIVPAQPGVNIRTLAISPDGSFVDYVRQEGFRAPELWRVPFLGGPPRKLIDRVFSTPGWSPDGRQMAILTGWGTLTIADADGSRARTVATRKSPARYLSLSYVLPQELRPVWLPDGRSVVVIGNDDREGYTKLQIITIDVATGSERFITLPETRQFYAGMGMALAPDGRSIVLTHSLEGRQPQIVRVDLATGALTRLTNDVNQYAGLHVNDRAIVTAHRSLQSGLWLVDGSTGDARMLGRDAPAELARGGIAWGAGGRLIYNASLAAGSGLWATDTNTGASQLIVPEATTPTTSADGRMLIFMRTTGPVMLSRSDADGRNAVEIPGAFGYMPSLAPDGRSVYYMSGKTGRQSAWVLDLTSGREPREVLPEQVVPFGVSVSPDGRLVMLSTGAEEGRRGVVIVPAGGGPPVRRLTLGDGGNRPQWMPDGRAIAYLSADDPANVWMQPLDGGPPRPVTRFTDRRIVAFAWSPDGTRLAVSRAADTSDILMLDNVRW